MPPSLEAASDSPNRSGRRPRGGRRPPRIGVSEGSAGGVGRQGGVERSPCLPSRTSVMVTVVPGSAERTAATSASAESMPCEPKPVMTSSTCRPISSAVLPGSTVWIAAPRTSPVALSTETPRRACWTEPFSISCSEIHLAWSIGMAKPSPMLPDWAPGAAPKVAMAELMPTSSPLRLTSAPPELPGLMAASVWMALRTDSSPAASPGRTGRFLALTIPVVTVPLSPSGEPMATTVSPTRRSSEEPSSTACRLSTPSTRMTARSELGSSPTISAGAEVPSWKVTLSDPPSAAPSTTWLFVRIRPDSSMTTPDPDPPPWDPVNWIETTLGSTSAATRATLPSGQRCRGDVPDLTGRGRRRRGDVVIGGDHGTRADAGTEGAGQQAGEDHHPDAGAATGGICCRWRWWSPGVLRRRRQRNALGRGRVRRRVRSGDAWRGVLRLTGDGGVGCVSLMAPWCALSLRAA